MRLRLTFITIDSSASSGDCNGDLEVEICSLVSAIGEYNITIEDDKMTVDSAAHPRIIGIANNTAVSQKVAAPGGLYLSTLAGIVDASYLIWNSYVFTAVQNGSINVQGAGNHKNLLFEHGVYNETTCPAWVDPREEYIASLNKLMVRHMPLKMVNYSAGSSERCAGPNRDRLLVTYLYFC